MSYLNHFSAWLPIGHLPLHLQEFTGALREEDTDQGVHVGAQFEVALLLSETCYTARGVGEEVITFKGVSYLMLPVVSGPLYVALL